MKIILATDTTKHSEAVFDFLMTLSLKGPGEIRIISVIDMAIQTSIDIYAVGFSTATEIENAAIANALKILDSAKTRIEQIFADKNISILTEILHGSPESRIVEKAEEIQADLIIVGSHGYNRWERLLLGSVSDAIVHHAPCSVLVVRNP